MIPTSIWSRTMIGVTMQDKLLMRCDQDDPDSVTKYFTIYLLIHWLNPTSKTPF